MRNILGPILILVFAVGIGGISYWELVKKRETQTAPLEDKTPPPPPVSEAPKYPVSPPRAEPTPEPVPEPPPPAPKAHAAKLPSQPKGPARAWTSVEDAASGLLGKAYGSMVEPEGLTHRIIVAVSNENSPQMPPDYLPWKPVAGDLAVDTKGDDVSLSSANYKRYKTMLKVLDSVSSKSLVKAYAQFYPAFQRTYEEIGSKGYFNDRLVEAIDDALAAPSPPGPIPLEKTTLHYKFKNPDLEGLSAGQKIMIRIGPENAAHLKAKLKEIRGLVTKMDKE